MTRIIGGEAGGRRLEVPKKMTRPTSDKVREAMFSMLQSEVSLADVAVLDLYAGSGALGLEAVSRGATSAVLVEASRAAAATAKQNVRNLGWESRIQVVTRRVQQFLGTTKSSFDVVFLDPPYDLPNKQLEEDLDKLKHLLVGPRMVVLERAKGAGVPTLPGDMHVLKHRSWGGTEAWFFEATPTC